MEYPRQDFLLKKRVKKDVFRTFFPDFYEQGKVIMCMPTFRQGVIMNDSQKVDSFALGVIQNRDELLALNDFLKENDIYLLVKLHPLQKTSLIQMECLSNITYAVNAELLEKKIILYELLSCCDALLTDVSSVYNDYFVLDRPVGFLFDNFANFERGYIVENPLDYMPGSYIHTYDDLLHFLVSIGNDDGLSAERERVYRIFHTGYTADNSKKLAEWLLPDVQK